MEAGRMALQKCATLIPTDLQPRLKDFQELYEQRLWHQLTERIREFYSLPNAHPCFPILFTGFISMWNQKMNPLVWIKLAIETAHQMNPSEALTLLEGVAAEIKTNIIEKDRQTGKEKEAEGAALLCLAMVAAAAYHLQLGETSKAKEVMERWATRVEGFASVDPIIPAAYFRLSAAYYKAIAAYADYYRNALLYLSCVRVEEVGQEEGRIRAHDLCVAALLGDSIYNFGELLAHPILDRLVGTPDAYLRDVLLAFNAGDHAAWQRHQSSLANHPTLSKQGDSLAQKMCLMALVETVFRHLRSARTISLEAISEATRVPRDQVEFLLIKALALKLVRGQICEPEGVFEIEWVQPRVLDVNQVRELRQGISNWRDRVMGTSGLVHTLLPDSLRKIVASMED